MSLVKQKEQKKQSKRRHKTMDTPSFYPAFVPFHELKYLSTPTPCDFFPKKFTVSPNLSDRSPSTRDVLPSPRKGATGFQSSSRSIIPLSSPTRWCLRLARAPGESLIASSSSHAICSTQFPTAHPPGARHAGEVRRGREGEAGGQPRGGEARRHRRQHLLPRAVQPPLLAARVRARGGLLRHLRERPRPPHRGERRACRSSHIPFLAACVPHRTEAEV